MIEDEEGDRLALAWTTYHALPTSAPERIKLEWAYDRLDQLVRSQPFDGLYVILKILNLTENKRVLSNLSAGPFEDLLVDHGENIIDSIEAYALHSQKIRRLLGGVWRNQISDIVWSRIQNIAEPFE